MLFRPWLLAGGVCWGLAVGTKWTAALPAGRVRAAVVAVERGARRSFGVRWPVLKSAVADGVPAFGYLVVVAFLVYVASWTGWLVHADEYEDHLSATQYTHYEGGKDWPTRTEEDASGIGRGDQVAAVAGVLPPATSSRSTATSSTTATHTYASKPSGWLLLNRPVGVDADVDIQPGTQGCQAPEGSDCLRQVLLLGTPALWWGGILALLYAVVRGSAPGTGASGWRSWGAATTWLPWLSTTTGRSSRSTRCSCCRSWSSRSRWPWAS